MPRLAVGVIDRADDGSSIVGPLFLFGGSCICLIHRQFGFVWVCKYLLQTAVAAY